MNSIDANLLKKTKDFYEYACKHEDNSVFCNPSNNADSYYIKYSESVHCESVLTEYDSEDVKLLRTAFQRLWGEESEIVLVVLETMAVAKMNKKNYLQEVDLHNYMM